MFIRSGRAITRLAFNLEKRTVEILIGKVTP